MWACQHSTVWCFCGIPNASYPINNSHCSTDRWPWMTVVNIPPPTVWSNAFALTIIVTGCNLPVNIRNDVVCPPPSAPVHQIHGFCWYRAEDKCSSSFFMFGMIIIYKQHYLFLMWDTICEQLIHSQCCITLTPLNNQEMKKLSERKAKSKMDLCQVWS